MSPKQWCPFWEFPFLVQWYHGKRSSTARLPVDREVLWVDLRILSISPELAPLLLLTLIKLVSQALFDILMLS